MNSSLLLTKILLRSRWLANDLRAGLGWKGSKVHPFRIILTYHGIDERGETKLNSRFLSRGELRKHLEWLARECEVIPLAEYFSRPLQGMRPEICLTFDDGYRNNHDLAAPLLREFGFPATFFITGATLRARSILWPDHLDLCARLHGQPLQWQGETYRFNRKGQYVHPKTGQQLKSLAKQAKLPAIQALESALDEAVPLEKLEAQRLYWELMGEQELKSLAAEPLFELGTHGLSHASLGAIALEDAEHEMREGKTWLENLSGKPVHSLAWPSGSYTPEATQAAYRLGYEQLLLMDYDYPGDAEDPRQAARFVANPHLSFLNQREAILKGRYL